jgi:HSP20 family protein
MANISRYDPFGEFVTLRHATDRLFEDTFVSPLTWRTPR